MYEMNTCLFSPEFSLFSVYWQIKRIFVSEDQKNRENKFKTMINAIKVSNDWPKYSEVLWVVSKVSDQSQKGIFPILGPSEAAMEGEHQCTVGSKSLDQQGNHQTEDV